MQRRHFLQSTSAAIAAIGLSQLDLDRQSLRYAQAASPSTARKRALLIGVSEYKHGSLGGKLGLHDLPGALNDIDMQHELLIHRFGFPPNDVRTLTNEAASRKGILQALTQLITETQPDDVVVIHYSGHGSTIDDPDRIFTDGLNGTIVPWDSDRPLSGGPIDDITSGTLFLLMAALKTPNITLVLDSCYAGGGTRGNLILRSTPGEAERLRTTSTSDRSSPFIASPDEIAYQTQLLQQLNVSRETWIEQRKRGIAKGVALAAARRNQEAADALFSDNAHAGVFTYALTRQLWQQTHNENMGTVLLATQDKTQRFLSNLAANPRTQTPELQEAPESGHQHKPTYFLSNFAAQQQRSAAAVITQVQDNQARLLLNGIEPQVLETVRRGSTLSLINAEGEAIGTVKITDRNQLKATGTVQLDRPGTIAPGTLLQEKSRIIPKDWRLRIGLDPSLTQTEQTIARTSLPKIQSRIEVLPLLQQEVHYILGRLTPAMRQTLIDRKAPYIPEINSPGLFYPNLEPLLNSFGTAGESIESLFTNKLRAKLQSLTAGRLLKLTLNPSSSALKVKATIQIVGSNSEQQISKTQQPPIGTSNTILEVKVGQQIQIVIQNDESKDLNCAIVLISTDGAIKSLPVLPKLPAKGTIVIPEMPGSITVDKPTGVAEMVVIVSDLSLQATQELQTLHAGNRTNLPVLELADSIVNDLTGLGNQRDPLKDRVINTSGLVTVSLPLSIVE